MLGIRGRGNGESGIFPKYHNFEVKKKDNEAEEEGDALIIVTNRE